MTGRPVKPIERTHNTPEEALGAIITKLRTGQGWSQGFLAKKIGYSKVYINRVEHGSQSPTLGMITATAQVFGLKASQLIARAERKLAR